jgi:hypothetical protein
VAVGLPALVQGFLGDVTEFAATVVGLDRAGDVDVGGGATDPVDHPVDQSVVFGLACTDLDHYLAGDEESADELLVEEPLVAEEHLVITGKGADGAAIQQDVAAFAACHEAAEDQVAALASSFSYSSVPSTPSASSSAAASSMRARLDSIKMRSASSMKTSGEAPLLETPFGEAPLL